MTQMGTLLAPIAMQPTAFHYVNALARRKYTDCSLTVWNQAVAEPVQQPENFGYVIGLPM